jgi:hypothetical protein
MVSRCQAILELGNANAAALAAKYNVSANDLKAARAAIAAFAGAQSGPRQSRAAQSSATKQLVKQFELLKEVLNAQLDPMMETFRETNPAFYAEYRSARATVGNAASRKAAEPAAIEPLAKAA